LNGNSQLFFAMLDAGSSRHDQSGARRLFRRLSGECILDVPFAGGRPAVGGTLIRGVLTLICLFIIYMPLYYTIASSLSVRTLVLLASQLDGRPATARVCARFISCALVPHRLQIMRTNGFLAETARGRFTQALKGRRACGDIREA
jgi:hypothetical protein